LLCAAGDHYTAAVLGATSRERLRVGARGVGVTLGMREVEAFARYHDLLVRWSRRINLTRVTAPDAMVDRHFVDCLALAPELAPASTLLDVGSGAGFPGAVVAIARADVHVTLCESVSKKAAFLRTLVHHLGLTCEVVDTRSEVLVRAGRTFDAVVSRAVLAPVQWTCHAAPLVAAGGRLFAMVAQVPSEQLAPLGFASPTVRPYLLPDASPRALLSWRRST
jgi:16S rRNA (guanine527-N7)-methyltransferase